MDDNVLYHAEQNSRGSHAKRPHLKPPIRQRFRPQTRRLRSSRSGQGHRPRLRFRLRRSSVRPDSQQTHPPSLHTHAVNRFLDWTDKRKIPLTEVTPCDVSDYLESLKLSIPSKKLPRAGLNQ